MTLDEKIEAYKATICNHKDVVPYRAAWSKKQARKQVSMNVKGKSYSL